MKKKLFFIATTLYNNAQAVRCSIKSAWYAFIAFIVSCLMLIAPVSISKFTTTGEAIMKNYPQSSLAIYELIEELDENNITCKIKNNKFSCDSVLNKKEYVYDIPISETKNVRYTIVLLDDDYQYQDEKLNHDIKQDNDNLIYFGKKHFHIREAVRTKEGKLESSVSTSGNYKHCEGFTFQNVTDYIDQIERQYKDSYNGDELKALMVDAGVSKTYEIMCDFLYSVSISDFNTILFVWLLLAVASCLLCVLSGAFILNYGNKKGNLSDEYGFKGSFKIACNLLLMPAILSVLIGLIMPESVIITAPILFYIRLFFIYRAQFTRKGQRIALKTHQGLEDMIN